MPTKPYSGSPFWGSKYDLGATGALGYNQMPSGISPWSVMVVGGAQLPGLFMLKRCQKRHTVDKKKPQGQTGETLTSLGAEAADIHGRLSMWLPIQWDAWQNLIPQLFIPPPQKGTPTFFACYHPALAAEGITQIYHVSHTPLMVREDGSEIGDVDIFWNEYLPPKGKNVTNTPTQQGDIAGNTYQIPTVFDTQAPPSQTEGSNPAQTPPFQPPGYVQPVSH